MEEEGARSPSPPGNKSRKKRIKRIASSSFRLVGCAGVGVVGLAVDVPAVCGIAVAKSPLFLWKGWKQEVINMEECVDDGSCSRTICLPVTGAMLVVWPVRVAASLASALVYSFTKGLNGAVVAYREKSIRCGLKHVIAAIAEYDELSNDMIHLREGTCLPKPGYKNRHRRRDHQELDHPVAPPVEPHGVSFHIIREIDLGKLFEFLASSGHGRRLLERGFTDKLTVDSAALTILSYLLTSTKQAGDQVERGNTYVEVSYYDSLETLQRQILDAELDATQESYLYDMVLCRRGDFQELDPIRDAMLQAFGRRIRGISAFLSRNPEFREKYQAAMDAAAAASTTALDPDRSLAAMEDMISFD